MVAPEPATPPADHAHDFAVPVAYRIDYRGTAESLAAPDKISAVLTALAELRAELGHEPTNEQVYLRVDQIHPSRLPGLPDSDVPRYMGEARTTVVALACSRCGRIRRVPWEGIVSPFDGPTTKTA